MNKKNIDLDYIFDLVHSESILDDIHKKTRKREYVFTRYVCFKLAWDYSFSLTNIGKKSNNRDHSTVIHAIKEFNDLYNQKIFSPYARIYDKCVLHLQTKDTESSFNVIKNEYQKKFMLNLLQKVLRLKYNDYIKFLHTNNDFFKTIENEKQSN